MDTMNTPLIGFNAEAENGGSHQAADPAKIRYERMYNEAQLDIDKGGATAAGCHLYWRFICMFFRQL